MKRCVCAHLKVTVLDEAEADDEAHIETGVATVLHTVQHRQSKPCLCQEKHKPSLVGCDFTRREDHAE